MKLLIIAVAAALLVAGGGFVFLRSSLAGGRQDPPRAVEGRFWDLRSRLLNGEPVELSRWRGQVVLVVNVASKCGLTPQYAGLEALYQEFKEAGFVILGFPSNDFLNQEPGTPREIQTFCSTEYGVTFPLLEKVKVKNDDRGEIYAWLTSGGLEPPTWNFTKYLVGRDGRLIARFGPRTAPDDPDLRRAIAAALAETPPAPD